MVTRWTRTGVKVVLVPDTVPTPATQVVSREQWLQAAIDYLRVTVFARYTLPAVHVSVGFPSVRALSAKNRAIGECWPINASADGLNHIFISPVKGDAVEVLGVLVHELVHAVAGAGAKHGKGFKTVAVGVGLEGKMTATVPGTELTVRLVTATAHCGAYPHVELNPTMRVTKKQTTRMCKLECARAGCGYVVRTTRKWIEIGVPTCCCGGEFEVEINDGDEGGDDE